MSVILKPADFSGFQELAQGPLVTPKLQAYIDRWEKTLVYQLLSNNQNPPTYPTGLADLFWADVSANNGVPTIARFLFIFNSFDQQDGIHLRHSNGMKDMLASLILYKFVSGTISVSGQAGIVTLLSNAGKKNSFADVMRWGESRWNEALETVENIAWWLRVGNKNGGGNAEYPEYINTWHQGRHSEFRPKFSSIL